MISAAIFNLLRWMLVYHDNDYEAHLERRAHPYAHDDPAHCCIDLRSHPELTEETLADFKPYADRGAVQRLYGLVRWLNGADSIFETNDSAFQAPPYPNPQRDQFKRDLQVMGRLTFFFRDLRINTRPAMIDWLCESLEEQIALQQRTLQFGCISYARFPHYFAALDGNPFETADGDALALKFWAWGNTDEEVFENLDMLFDGMRGALIAISDFAKARLR
ncbi:hypothetical protein [Bradyrhizobium sp. JYMT SZCCT0428]|uniref:hypothetical protein n=1 Tax=Bradyrhizobium sp. JYMT SZCCT0428 TaxID=2807673 RepID=UPI001BAAF5B9|nr:hypothetical protein [Bradyrhizobium sp. JYMT SZCCT0428]